MESMKKDRNRISQSNFLSSISSSSQGCHHSNWGWVRFYNSVRRCLWARTTTMWVKWPLQYCRPLMSAVSGSRGACSTHWARPGRTAMQVVCYCCRVKQARICIGMSTDTLSHPSLLLIFFWPPSSSLVGGRGKESRPPRAGSGSVFFSKMETSQTDGWKELAEKVTEPFGVRQRWLFWSRGGEMKETALMTAQLLQNQPLSPLFPPSVARCVSG